MYQYIRTGRRNNNIYAYKEGGYVDLVRLLEVYKEKGYLYSTLNLMSQNKIITTSQILKKNTYIIWRLMENMEFDEIMSKIKKEPIELSEQISENTDKVFVHQLNALKIIRFDGEGAKKHVDSLFESKKIGI